MHLSWIFCLFSCLLCQFQSFINLIKVRWSSTTFSQMFVTPQVSAKHHGTTYICIHIYRKNTLCLNSFQFIHSMPNVLSTHIADIPTWLPELICSKIPNISRTFTFQINITHISWMNQCLFEYFLNLIYSLIDSHQGLHTHKWCYSPSEDHRGVFIVSPSWK